MTDSTSTATSARASASGGSATTTPCWTCDQRQRGLRLPRRRPGDHARGVRAAAYARGRDRRPGRPIATWPGSAAGSSTWHRGELADDVLYQIGALEACARAAGGRVAYVKPHGALYNATVHHEAQAAAVVEASGVRRAADPRPARLAAAGRRRGGRPGCVPEAFADRGYTPEGTLVPRTEPDALLPRHDAAVVDGRCGWPTTARSSPSTGPCCARPPGRCACTATPPAPSRHAIAVRAALTRPRGVPMAPFADLGHCQPRIGHLAQWAAVRCGRSLSPARGTLNSRMLAGRPHSAGGRLKLA